MPARKPKITYQVSDRAIEEATRTFFRETSIDVTPERKARALQLVRKIVMAFLQAEGR